MVRISESGCYAPRLATIDDGRHLRKESVAIPVVTLTPCVLARLFLAVAPLAFTPLSVFAPFTLTPVFVAIN
ncbi:hypothetical protein CR51_26580 [Caballeronia megalochromosomata]|nr:hypothetical protein CR51_26580 [Caballeronia megalochromosomata]